MKMSVDDTVYDTVLHSSGTSYMTKFFRICILFSACVVIKLDFVVQHARPADFIYFIPVMF